MVDIEKVTCCVCDNTAKPILVLESSREGWHIVRCPQCELTFVHPQPAPETISEFYNGMYSELASDYNEQKMQWARNSVKGYCSNLKKIDQSANSTILDLGGGLGYYSKAFEEAGFLVTLVEQDPVSVQFAQTHLRISDIRSCSIEDFFKQNKRTFDVVFLRHVIEHSTNPDSLMKKVMECLSNHGVLIIETDNNAGVELLFRPGSALFYMNLYRSSYKQSSYFSLLKKRPFAVDPPRHLYGFRISNLSMLLQKNSLIPAKTKCYRLGHPVYWPNLPQPTLGTVLTNLRQLKFAYFAANLLDIMLFPARLLLEYTGLASGICIYAIKNTKPM